LRLPHLSAMTPVSMANIALANMKPENMRPTSVAVAPKLRVNNGSMGLSIAKARLPTNVII